MWASARFFIELNAVFLLIYDYLKKVYLSEKLCGRGSGNANKLQKQMKASLVDAPKSMNITRLLGDPVPQSGHNPPKAKAKATPTFMSMPSWFRGIKDVDSWPQCIQLQPSCECRNFALDQLSTADCCPCPCCS